MKRRFSEEQIIGILKEAQASGVKATCAKHNISEATYYSWKRKYGGMEVAEARRLRGLARFLHQVVVCAETGYVRS